MKTIISAHEHENLTINISVSVSNFQNKEEYDLWALNKKFFSHEHLLAKKCFKINLDYL